jgi:hypothetical protein
VRGRCTIVEQRGAATRLAVEAELARASHPQLRRTCTRTDEK